MDKNQQNQSKKPNNQQSKENRNSERSSSSYKRKKMTKQNSQTLSSSSNHHVPSTSAVIPETVVTTSMSNENLMDNHHSQQQRQTVQQVPMVQVNESNQQVTNSHQEFNNLIRNSTESSSVQQQSTSSSNSNLPILQYLMALHLQDLARNQIQSRTLNEEIVDRSTQQQQPVLVFNEEMARKQLFERLISTEQLNYNPFCPLRFQVPVGPINPWGQNIASTIPNSSFVPCYGNSIWTVNQQDLMSFPSLWGHNPVGLDRIGSNQNAINPFRLNPLFSNPIGINQDVSNQIRLISSGSNMIIMNRVGLNPIGINQDSSNPSGANSIFINRVNSNQVVINPIGPNQIFFNPIGLNPTGIINRDVSIPFGWNPIHSNGSFVTVIGQPPQLMISSGSTSNENNMAPLLVESENLAQLPMNSIQIGTDLQQTNSNQSIDNNDVHQHYSNYSE
ncbi:hypothetical protein DERF_004441 [Dermatophagoides farinae]|uniref:Uncharacterized protein n=1 Tax=Dermatophagoides farinae TaxID=6954 RepID=A0A922L560_DERFA|nr:hypothetical protein DERF_004441 [Dermatophagoides farinae]